ncbi:MAG TPA: DUF5667 domain-containing protein [Anaerolineales bacterium]|nr:DUF5667 domain-containing protein [Anaerolineales bacterium]HNN12678.1 DUF5667 domain-containing protein [Anaerolineales bacterium]
MNNKLFDALEICLQEVEDGAEVEAVLAYYPDLASELRPILKTAAKARKMAAAEPAPEVVRRGRARVMQRAAELREVKLAPKSKRVIPAFQRLVISFSLATLLLMSGSGLVNVSASALPGERLYPVKRTWEGLRLIFIFDQNARRMLEDEYESERLHEVTELLGEGRHESIQFAGVFMQVNGVTYVSGVQVILPNGVSLPGNGAPVVVNGRTNAQGFVELSLIEPLPDGVVVPVGKPVALESETGDGSDSQQPQPQPEPSAQPSFGNETAQESPNYYEIKGALQSASMTTLTINDLTIHLNGVKVEGQICNGVEVEVKGYYSSDGRFIATEAKVEGPCTDGNVPGGDPGSESDNSNSGGSDENGNDSGSNSGNNGGDQGGDNSNSDDHSGGDDNSNSNDDSGGGGGSNDNGGHGGDDNKNDNSDD